MNPHVVRASDDLSRALSDVSVPRKPVVEDDRVILGLPLVRQLMERIAFMEGGHRLPFVRALIARPTADGVSLSPDEAQHLARALSDIAREEKRRRDLDRGIVRGSLSSSEAVRLTRRFPGMFRQR